MDEYILENNGLSLVYLKNGKVHRENGPAMFFIKDKELYNFNIDKDIYNEQKIDFSLYYDMAANSLELSNFKKYYLDNIEYSENDFLKVMEVRNLQNELETAYPISDIKSKKAKI